MPTPEEFRAHIEEGYTFKGPSFVLGGAMLGEATQTGTLVRIPLGTLNRHGLIAGATGTGKTKTLQIIAEQLSKEGVPSLLMDIKGTSPASPWPAPATPRSTSGTRPSVCPLRPAAARWSY